jgi:hypothetical protein
VRGLLHVSRQILARFDRVPLIGHSEPPASLPYPSVFQPRPPDRSGSAVCSQDSSTNPSTSWSEREGGLRGLCPDVPVVKTADTGQADDPASGRRPGLDCMTPRRVPKAGVDPLGVVVGKGGGRPCPEPRGRHPLPRSGRPSPIGVSIGVYPRPSPATDFPELSKCWQYKGFSGRETLS